ncbi:MAG: hypothetical protein IT443_12410 [Phycisphaeraceae bacterium]|nr:hypothetical protein [Phycisphaeraceae bacterium]
MPPATCLPNFTRLRRSAQCRSHAQQGDIPREFRHLTVFLLSLFILAAVLVLGGCSLFHSDNPATQPTPRPTATQATQPAAVGNPQSPAAHPDSVNVEQLIARLIDPQIEPQLRRQIAFQLLTEEGAVGVTAVADHLHSDDPALLSTLLLAVSNLPTPPPPSLLEPLEQLLPTIPQPLVSELATALGRYTDRNLRSRLVRLASTPTAPVSARQAATLTLGYEPSRTTIVALLPLLEDPLPVIRASARQSLVNATGLTFLTDDPTQWQAWWDQHRYLSEEQLVLLLAGNLSSRMAVVVTGNQALVDRLVQLYRQSYLQAAPARRLEMLLAMLHDPVADVRSLAVDLLSQRLVDGGSNGVEASLRQALVDRIDDPVPEVRRRVVLLLRDLADPEGSLQVAQRLARGLGNTPSSVVTAYLLMVARVPTPGAVDPAIDLLSDPVLGLDAARALLSAADANLLTSPQREQAVRRVRAIVKSDNTPDPAFILLLGRIGGEADWLRLAGWLTHADDRIREAAARAWALAGRSLEPLAKQANDPVILPILIGEAARRGDGPEVFFALASHRPFELEASPAWEDAITKMASRLDADSVLLADQRMADLGRSLDLRERLLSAAIGPKLTEVNEPANLAALSPSALGQRPHDPEKVALLLFARAAVRLNNLDVEGARRDYQRIPALADKITLATRQRAQDGIILTSLLLNDSAAAFAQARESLQALSTTELEHRQVQIGYLFLEAAARSLSQEQVDSARQLLDGLLNLLPATPPAELQEAIDSLRQKLASLVYPTATQPAPDNSPPAQPGKNNPSSSDNAKHDVILLPTPDDLPTTKP